MKPIPELSAVKALDNEFLCFEVRSLTTPGVIYRVDMVPWWQSGACSCHDFCCRVQVQLGKGDWTEPTTCKHIRLVYRFIAVNGARKAIAERVKLQPNYRYSPSEPNL